MIQGVFYSCLLLLFPPISRAHGWAASYQIGQQNYSGWDPWHGREEANKPDSVAARRYTDNGPINGVDNPKLLCRGDNAPVQNTVDVQAGDTVKVFWTGADSGMWPGSNEGGNNHIGPVLTYLASCNGSCSQFPATGQVWFKIDESQTWDGTKWATQKMREAGSIYTYDLPSDIKSGEYLMRHEIIALHQAYSPGGAQFYPNCLQINIHGSGSKTVTQGLVSFPGAYQDSDPGITLNVWDPPFKDASRAYINPGPPLYNAVSDTNTRISKSFTNTLPSSITSNTFDSLLTIDEEPMVFTKTITEDGQPYTITTTKFLESTMTSKGLQVISSANRRVPRIQLFTVVNFMVAIFSIPTSK